MKHPDGSVISQFFQTTDKPQSGQDIYNQGLKIVIGQIEKIHYVDDSSNISKQFVEYDVTVRDDKAGQSLLRNLRKVDLLGGSNDYDELILEANQYAFKGKLEVGNLFKNKNGTIALVASLDGSRDKPFILAVVQHPRSSGAKRKDGIHRKGEFRGVQWEINKDGELSITYLSPKSPDGKRVAEDTGPTQVKISKTGAVSVTDNKSQSILMDRTSTVIKLSNSVSVTLDGSSNSVTVRDAGTGEIKLQDSKVAIGSSSAELLQQISDSLSKLITLFSAVASHTHIGNLGYPTSAPDTQGAWTTASSELSTIKGLVDSIKGTL